MKMSSDRKQYRMNEKRKLDERKQGRQSMTANDEDNEENGVAFPTKEEGTTVAFERQMSFFYEKINSHEEKMSNYEEKISLLEAKNEDLEEKNKSIMLELATIKTSTPGDPDGLESSEIILKPGDVNDTAKTVSEQDACKRHEIGVMSGDVDDLDIESEPATSKKEKYGRSSSIVIQDEIHYMNMDAYTFLYTSPFWSVQHFLGKLICFIQFAIFSLFCLDLWKTQTVPPNVDDFVRFCQIIAILVSFVAETDMRISLRSLIYREGFQEIGKTFPSFAVRKYIIANILMFLQGALGQVVTFLLIIFSNNIFDLLLNFTAVMFVSQLDELIFALAHGGYAGRRTQKLCKLIQSVKFPPELRTGIMKYMHIYLYISFVVAAYIAFGMVAHSQINNERLEQVVKVSFGDEIDPTLGLYSGCYDLEANTDSSDRVKYIQRSDERGQGVFEYCDLYKTWVFASDQLENPCDNPALRSSQKRATSFRLMEAQVDQWLLPNGNPVSTFKLQAVEPHNVDEECDSSDLDVDLCSVLVVNSDLPGFSGTRDWSRIFEVLMDGQQEIQYYRHLVFFGGFTDSHGFELILFTGRRWVIGSSVFMMREIGGDPNKIEDVVALFKHPDFLLKEIPSGSFEFVSESVDASTDRGTPLGLRWFHSRYADGEYFPFADSSRPSDAIFQCGKCHAKTNPCFYEGECQADGTCLCKHGASGKLCDIKPLGDGECNPFFNFPYDEFDGGDCCVASCSSQSCGIGDMKFAFGQELKRGGTGFPHCSDPSMVPMSIFFKTTIDREQDFEDNFESYTVEVRCDEGQEIPLRVALDPNITGELKQEIYVADRASSCFLTFFSIQSWTQINIAFQVLDGYGFDESHTYVMKEEMNVTVDGNYELPALYSRCLKETLAEFIEPWYLYSGSYQDESVAWIDKEMIEGTNCNNREFLIERYALVSLYFAELAPESWISPDDHCLWSRVTCDDNRVVELTYDGFTNGALMGVLATELGLLINLERLDVFGNSFKGKIPTELGGMGSLKFIDLSENELTGTIPSELGRLSANIYIDSNQLSGAIPTELVGLSSLELVASFNQLTGSIPTLPKHLELLYLHFNLLSGPIPTDLPISLAEVSLRYNLLTGSIPTELAAMDSLTLLRLGFNLITGSIPTELAVMASLQVLHLNDNDLTGGIPTTLPATLNEMKLQRNQLTGSLPMQLFSDLKALTIMSLHDNLLTGFLPTEIGNMQNLEQLDIANNELNGSLPTSLGLLTSLKALDLGGNNHEGTIPTEIGMLTNLQSLVLKDNKLEGTIPTEMMQLTNLINLQLSGNLLDDESLTEVLVALDLFFVCDDGITVETALKTDAYPEETSWELLDQQGFIAASGGEYGLSNFDYEKKYCVPTDACNFFLYDDFCDGGASMVISRLNKTYSVSDYGEDCSLSIDIC